MVEISLKEMADHAKNCQVDSRKVGRGDLFFALKGACVDGHNFLEEVAAKGALAAVVDSSYRGPHYGLSLLSSNNVLTSFQELAKERITSMKMRIVGITGSLGKTTAKAFLTTLLQKKFHVVSSPGNQNSQIGVPLTVCNSLTGNEEVYIQEMAMTEPGQIARLTEIVPPEVALITSVALVHAEGFDSLEEIARAKAEIAIQPETKRLIVDRDWADICGETKGENCTVSTISTSKADATYFLCNSREGIAGFEGRERRMTFDGPLFFAPHHLHNLCAAAAIARYLGMEWEEIRERIPYLRPVENRGVIVKQGGVTFVNDAYNAALPSVQSALSHLPEPKNRGRKIAVLGTMPELGKFSESCHRTAGTFALDHVDQLFCYGKETRPLCEEWERAGRTCNYFEERDPLVAALRRELSPGDVVLLKGANYLRLWTLIPDVVEV